MTVEPEYDMAMRNAETTLDLDMVRKQNWKTAPHRDTWQDDLATITVNHDERLVEAVGNDEAFREAAVIPVPDDEWREFAQQCNRAGVAFAEAESTHAAHITAYRTEHRAESSPMVVGADGDTADEVAALYEQAGDRLTGPDLIRDLGGFMGVPDCCVDAYVERVLDTHRQDPIYEAACASPSAETIEDEATSVRVPDADGLLNPVWRFLGWHLIDFLPCSFECEAARERGIANGKVWRECGYGDEAEALWEFLAEPTTWSAYHGLAHVKNGHSIGEYVTDDNWDEKTVVFKREHDAKAAVEAESAVSPGPADPDEEVDV